MGSALRPEQARALFKSGTQLPANSCASLLCASAFAQGVGQRQIAWNDLPVIFNKNIRIVMPDGTRIEGKATELEADALAVQVGKTTNENAYPKGRLLVPRATL